MDSDVTRMLGEIAAGRREAAGELLPVVYGELRKLAAAQLSRLRPGETLQPTALVHEAYLRLVGAADPGWNGRGHFFGAAAQAMRELIVDHVRRRSAAKRGSGRRPAELDAAFDVASGDLGLEDVLAVDAALKRLEGAHPRKAQVVVMRYFGGLSEEESAEALGVTARTVERDWRFARAFLHEALEQKDG
ncbi:ECF-type sigma factor [Sorangium sp. So ce145]|uniref:ECF-type sigma factor n=1 Tax=Sorangium sp. So ce145 TaxID=3133285 RepID=UPI003F5DC701